MPNSLKPPVQGEVNNILQNFKGQDWLCSFHRGNLEVFMTRLEVNIAKNIFTTMKKHKLYPHHIFNWLKYWNKQRSYTYLDYS